jgi:carbon-monoxide dehydrogenase small subunit
MLVAARDLVRRKGGLSRQDIRHEMSGNLCRCTGYANIVRSVLRAAELGQDAAASAAAGDGGAAS